MASEIDPTPEQACWIKEAQRRANALEDARTRKASAEEIADLEAQLAEADRKLAEVPQP